MGLKHPLDEFERKATQPVSEGNHNLVELAFACELQDGSQTLALEVDAAPDVGDDLVAGEALAHVLDLALEVVPLTDR
jgi:hypothetical protein